MPKRLLVLCVEVRGREIDGDLAQELVGAESVVVPDSDLEHVTSEVGHAERREDEGLVPLRVACVQHSLGPTLRLLAEEDGGRSFRTMNQTREKWGREKREKERQREREVVVVVVVVVVCHAP